MNLETTRASIGRRVVIVGSTCAGKTTLAQRLATLLDVPATDLDELHWEPNWISAERDVVRERVR